MNLRRSEIKTRKLEMLAEIEKTLRREVVDDSAARERFKKQLKAISDAADAKVDAAVAKFPELFGEGGRWERPGMFHTPSFYVRSDQNEDRRRQAAMSAVQARVARAEAEVNRLELELLQTVASSALLTDAARQLAASLPSLDDLLSISS